MGCIDITPDILENGSSNSPPAENASLSEPELQAPQLRGPAHGLLRQEVQPQPRLPRSERRVRPQRHAALPPLLAGEVFQPRLHSPRGALAVPEQLKLLAVAVSRGLRRVDSRLKLRNRDETVENRCRNHEKSRRNSDAYAVWDANLLLVQPKPTAHMMPLGQVLILGLRQPAFDDCSPAATWKWSLGHGNQGQTPTLAGDSAPKEHVQGIQVARRAARSPLRRPLVTPACTSRRVHLDVDLPPLRT